MSEVLEKLNALLSADNRIDHDASAFTEHRPDDERHLKQVPKIICADGFTMSVQASFFHYCAPRDSLGPYSAVEVGFPSEKVDAFMDYAEDAENPTDTVYGWVPVAVVADAIEAHGGFASADT